jgi:hypothetical protein
MSILSNYRVQLPKKYGDQLVCVRYRYDKARQKRLKAIEIIADEQDWMPGAYWRRKPPKGLIHHSNRGSQYAQAIDWRRV